MTSARTLGLLLLALVSMILIEASTPSPTQGSLPEGAMLAGSDSAEIVSNEVVIRLTPGSHRNLRLSSRGMSNIPSLNSLAARLGVRSMQAVVPRSGAERELQRWYVIKLDGESKEIPLSDARNPRTTDPAARRFREALAEYVADPHVEVAEPNYIVRVTALPNDYYYGNGDLWGLRKINAEGAWDVTTGGSGVVVAVSDTGVDPGHPDLAGRMWTNPNEIPGDGLDNDANGHIDDIRGWDFVGDDADPQDDHAHGTHVAGTIAATGANHSSGLPSDGKALVGVSWSAKIMALKSFDARGGGTTANGAATIDYARSKGAQVVNMSWGGGGVSGLLETALQEAHDAGVVLVAAAGNSSDDAYNQEPANSPYVITVAATNSQDQRACFSNFGVKIDVGAPGGDSSTSCNGRDDYILSALSNQISAAKRQNFHNLGLIADCCYLKLRGTSMAAPHVAGLAALIKAKYPAYTNEEIRQILRITADDVGGKPWTGDTGYGRINAAAAVAQASAPPVAWIDTPRNRTKRGGTFVGDSLQITGKASGANSTYRIYVGMGEDPTLWTEIASGPASGNISTQVNVGGVGLKSGDAMTIRLAVTPQSGAVAEDRAKMFFDAAVHQYWPILGENLDANQWSDDVARTIQPAIVDLTGDLSLEAVGITSYLTFSPTTRTSTIYAWDANANSIWSYSLGQYPEWPTGPLVADLIPTTAGNETVVVSTSSGYYAQATTAVTVLGADGQLIRQVSWTYQSNTCRNATSPVATDTDNDGVKEIILSCEYKVVALDPVSGAIKDQSAYNGLLGSGSGLIVANIDGTGDEEVVVIAANAINVLNSSDLEPHPNWTTPLDLSSPWLRVAKRAAVGNIDGDADLEIVIGGVWNDTSIGEIRAYNPDKTAVWASAPSFGLAPYGAGGVFLADMDRDGSQDIVIHEAGVHVFAASGQEMTGWDQFSEASVSFSTPGDIDDDGDLELLLADTTGLRAYKRFGGVVWSREYGPFVALPSTLGIGPTAADLNRDGVLDLIGLVTDGFAGAHKIFNWELAGVSVPAGSVYTPMSGFDPERTGVFTGSSYPSVTNDGDGLLDTVEPPGCVGLPDCESGGVGDGVVDGLDNCVTTVNEDQTDTDNDGAGDACDSDDDNDGIADASDNCPTAANASQQNTDGGPEGDACDTDDDGDGVADTSDNCALVANANQADFDGDTWGDVCDSDDDRDALADSAEPGCTLDSDCDNDNVSDGSADIDGAGPIVAGPDNCITISNPDQLDTDQDGKGNVCDPDDDNDLVYDIDEVPCGSDPLDVTPPLSRPERIDGVFAGVDDDGDTQIDEALPSGAVNFDCDGDGYKGIVESGAALCSGSTNDESYDDANVNDGCPAQGGAEISCADSVDNDVDGFVNDGCPKVGTWSEGEFKIGTSDQDPCGNNGWPADLAGSDNRVDVQDSNSFTTPVSRINTSPGDANYDKRWDLVPGKGPFLKFLNIMDLTSITVLAPPMLGGVKAYNGPACPWP